MTDRSAAEADLVAVGVAVGDLADPVAVGLVGVPISYAIGQSAPLIAASWGVLVWREFRGAPNSAWVSLGWMVALPI